MAEPRLLQVGTEETIETVKGESGLSSAQVGTEAKVVEKSNDDTVGVYVADTNVVSDNSRTLKVSKERPAGVYEQNIKQAEGFERSKGEQGVVNTITVDEVKALIKQYGGGDTYTKEEIDHIVETMRKGLYQEVDTTEYPTLEDFLESDGEEGIIYLYPVGNEGNNYYQYIWETTKEWISLGTTVVDLSQYAKLTLLAPIYDSTATYSVGAKCVYNGKLYTCSTAITQAEDFDATHWTEISVSSGFVDLDSAQTITGQKIAKEFIFEGSNPITIRQKSSQPFSNQFALYNDGSLNLANFNTQGVKQDLYIINANNFSPNGTRDLGSSSRKWKDIYLSGKIKDGTNEFNADNVFNVINASDIVNNTLTQAQMDLIINGRPTRIEGTFDNKQNVVFLSAYNGSSIIEIIASFADLNYKGFTYYTITKSTGFINSRNNYIRFGTNQIRFDVDNGGDWSFYFNGKKLPTPPTTNTSPQYLQIGASGGNLSYDDPFNPASVSLSDGGTISDTTLQANIQYHRPIVLNGFTCYFSCDDGTNYQYTSMRYDANANKNHINVITINKSTWVATFHTSDLTLN